jgi:hypothetical protein
MLLETRARSGKWWHRLQSCSSRLSSSLAVSACAIRSHREEASPPGCASTQRSKDQLLNNAAANLCFVPDSRTRSGSQPLQPYARTLS